VPRKNLPSRGSPRAPPVLAPGRSLQHSPLPGPAPFIGRFRAFDNRLSRERQPQTRPAAASMPGMPASASRPATPDVACHRGDGALQTKRSRIEESVIEPGAQSRASCDTQGPRRPGRAMVARELPGGTLHANTKSSQNEVRVAGKVPHDGTHCRTGAGKRADRTCPRCGRGGGRYTCCPRYRRDKHAHCFTGVLVPAAASGRNRTMAWRAYHVATTPAPIRMICIHRNTEAY